MEKKKVIKELSNTIIALGLDTILEYPAKVIASYIYKDLERLKWFNTAKAVHNCSELVKLYTDADICIPDSAWEIKEKQNSVNDFVDRMYEIYPARCPKRNASTGKSHKDKDRIKRLLKIYTQDEIEKVIRDEVDNNFGVNYMKNFSTFLNNFPAPQTETPKVETKVNELIINGVKYQ